jgi:hypothetical protein
VFRPDLDPRADGTGFKGCRVSPPGESVRFHWANNLSTVALFRVAASHAVVSSQIPSVLAAKRWVLFDVVISRLFVGNGPG